MHPLQWLAFYALLWYNYCLMVKKYILFDKLHKFIKSTLKSGTFFSDQHLLKNQISIDDMINDKNEQENVAERIGDATQEITKQSTKKKKVLNLIFFLINIVVVVCILVFQLFNSDVQGFDEIINAGNFRGEFILIILLAFVLIMFLDSHRVTYLLKRSTKRSRPFLCYKMTAIGKYYDCVTPMSTGGQPFRCFI